MSQVLARVSSSTTILSSIITKQTLKFCVISIAVLDPPRFLLISSPSSHHTPAHYQGCSEYSHFSKNKFKSILRVSLFLPLIKLKTLITTYPSPRKSLFKLNKSLLYSNINLSKRKTKNHCIY